MIFECIHKEALSILEDRVYKCLNITCDTIEEYKIKRDEECQKLEKNIVEEVANKHASLLAELNAINKPEDSTLLLESQMSQISDDMVLDTVNSYWENNSQLVLDLLLKLLNSNDFTFYSMMNGSTKMDCFTKAKLCKLFGIV